MRGHWLDVHRRQFLLLLADPGMRRSLLPGNREISIAVPTSRGRDRVGKSTPTASMPRFGNLSPATNSLRPRRRLFGRDPLLIFRALKLANRLVLEAQRMQEGLVPQNFPDRCTREFVP